MSKHYFEADNANDLYLQLIESISKDPQYEASPRGMHIKENVGVIAKILNAKNCLITLKERKLNYAFAAIEKLEYLSGHTDPDRLVFYNSNFENYRGEYGLFDGAYPERLGYWYRHIYNLLKADPDTRQAVMSIYGPQDRHKSKDIPCTILFQFLIRNGKLNMVSYMRSNDMLWGFPYDTNGFCFIQQALAALLHIEVGTYELHAGSLHIYTEREEQLTKLIDNKSDEFVSFQNPEIPFYKDIDDLHNDLQRFWVKEYSLRNNIQTDEEIFLPAWLKTYYDVVEKSAIRKNAK